MDLLNYSWVNISPMFLADVNHTWSFFHKGLQANKLAIPSGFCQIPVAYHFLNALTAHAEVWRWLQKYCFDVCDVLHNVRVV